MMTEISLDDPGRFPDRREAVDVITVNWNAGHQLASCVESVRDLEPDIVQTFTVVDNGSTDSSLASLPEWGKLHVDRVGANVGFGNACNRGAVAGGARYILLLNPDAGLIEPAVGKAVDFLESPKGKKFAVCGVRLLDDAGTTTRPCARFPTLATFLSEISGLAKLLPNIAPSLLMRDFDHERNCAVDHVQGSFYLVRRSAFEAVGGFDPAYFVYFEDIDLSRRLKLARLGGCYYLADAVARHSGGGTSKQVRGLSRFYGIEGRILYASKHFSLGASAVHLIGTLVVEPVATMLWHLGKYRGRGLTELFRAFSLLFRAIPASAKAVIARGNV